MIDIAEIRSILDVLGGSSPPGCLRCDRQATHVEPEGMLREDPPPRKFGPVWLCSFHAEEQAMKEAAGDVGYQMQEAQDLLRRAGHAKSREGVMLVLREYRDQKARLVEDLEKIATPEKVS